MRTGKVKESVLKRSVLRQLHRKNMEDSPASGEDAGVLFVPGNSEKNGIVALQNPVEGWTLAPKRAVYGAVNSLIASGAKPEAISLSVLMPEETEEARLKQLMKQVDVLCKQEGIIVLSGHTAVSAHVDTLLLSVTALGRINQGKRMSEKTGANCDLVALGTAGREGAALIAAEQEEMLLKRFAPSYLETAKHLYDDGSMKNAGDIIEKIHPLRVQNVREGGIFAGLWKIASAGHTGISVDLKKIPIRQHTIEVCEYFQLNPYMLLSGGTMLLICENGATAADAFQEAGIPAAVIGKTTGDNNRIIHYDEEVRFLEPPHMDEYYKTLK
ncbi:MAG: AIR synthase related protein [Eubacterium sp.]|nr:AIR synthase related protein [Eubacterium sp.]MDD7210265.1 AIR synthase related protein [Lachnospiraceae bacterium]MDY5496813.1 AIR synthase related protein [Anaerobutyricum sp.]